MSLFADWRAFQKPKLVDGVPDYTKAAMAAQRRDLPSYRRRLDAIDASGWPVNQQVDWHVVRAEMNGLDFDHRRARALGNQPCVLRYGIHGAKRSACARRAVGLRRRRAVDLFVPPVARACRQMDAGIRAIPPLLEQAQQRNLVGTGKKDLWVFGTRSVREQSAALAALGTRLDTPGTAGQESPATGPEGAALLADIQRAKTATDAFAAWLDSQAANKTGPSGIGVENYDWYLKNVQLVPYSWQGEVTIMERELARAQAFLALEEQRNAALPAQPIVASQDEHARRFDAAVSEYMAFLKDHDILTIRDYMDPALRAKVGRFAPGPREFFTEVDYRDPEVMRTHSYHWFDLGRMANEPHASAIRRGPLLYNIFNTRTEGHATGWEEMMLQAGMFDARPRSRELIYVLLAERAARALGDLQDALERVHARTSGPVRLGEHAARLAAPRCRHRARRAAPVSAAACIRDQLRHGQDSGRNALFERRQQLGDRFTMKSFMDDFNAAGLVPASLVRWELTGRLPPELATMLAPSR